MENRGTPQDREARLAEALRANLRKRKAQGKARDADPPGDDPGVDDTGQAGNTD